MGKRNQDEEDCGCTASKSMRFVQFGFKPAAVAHLLEHQEEYFDQILHCWTESFKRMVRTAADNFRRLPKKKKKWMMMMECIHHMCYVNGQWCPCTTCCDEYGKCVTEVNCPESMHITDIPEWEPEMPPIPPIGQHHDDD